jgi:DNA-binding NarL/FixJ family response regulator
MDVRPAAWTYTKTEVKMKTILIADPDPAIRSALALILRSRFGADDVCLSKDMLTFAFSMAACAPRILLFDAGLYHATALEACLVLRQTYPALELVLLSAREDDGLAAEKAGAHFIHKGDSPEKILATLAPLLKEECHATR